MSAAWFAIAFLSLIALYVIVGAIGRVLTRYDQMKDQRDAD